MTTINFSSIFVPLVGLIFPVIAMVSFFLHVQKKRLFRSWAKSYFSRL